MFQHFSRTGRRQNPSQTVRWQNQMFDYRPLLEIQLSADFLRVVQYVKHTGNQCRVNLGDNCIQNVHLGRYIVGYMVRNFVLRRRISGAVKHNFWPYNQWYTSPNEHFECGYPHSNALFNIYLSKAQHFAPNWSFVSKVKQLRQPITSNVTYDVAALTVYRRKYWRKFLMLSNQTLRYIRKCIRM